MAFEFLSNKLKGDKELQIMALEDDNITNKQNLINMFKD